MSYARFWNLHFHLFFLVLSRFQDWSSTYVLLPFVCIIHVILWKQWFLGGFGQEGLKFLQILLQLNTALVLIRYLIWTSKLSHHSLFYFWLFLSFYLDSLASVLRCAEVVHLWFTSVAQYSKEYIWALGKNSQWGSLYILYHHTEDVNPALVFSSFCTVTGIIYLQPEL